MKNAKINRGHIFIYIILIAGITVTIFPFIWMILTSFKTQYESTAVPLVIFPERWIYENYFELFHAVPFLKMYMNTIISALITVVTVLGFGSMAAYAFARIKFPGRDVIFMIYLAILMVPGSVFILPWYLFVQKMGLLDSLPALFLPNLFSAYSTFLLRQFFLSLPNDLEEAARLDGCSPFKIYSQIMLPLIKSGMVALGILVLRFAWNDLMWPMIVNTSQEKMSLSAGLAYMNGQYIMNYPLMMAGGVMAVIPLLVVYAIFQEQFIEGIAMSGIKG